MNKIKQRKCIYSECALPENNNYYLWQIAFLILGIGILIADPIQFTPLAIFLFVTPILLNLLYNKLVPEWLKYIKFAFICINVFIVLFCFFGIANILIIDVGEAFKVSEKSLLYGNLTIEKTTFVYLMLINLLIPIMFYFGTPNQATVERVKFVNERMESKV